MSGRDHPAAWLQLSTGERWRLDSITCPRCGARVGRAESPILDFILFDRLTIDGQGRFTCDAHSPLCAVGTGGGVPC